MRTRPLKIKFLLFAILSLIAVTAYAATCSVDNSSAYFTGQTRIDSATGKLLKLYRCSRGHEFWSTR